MEARQVREYFEEINNRFSELRLPSEHLAIDETLYPYRGRIDSKQYGLLYRSLGDSAVQYTVFSLPYAW